MHLSGHAFVLDRIHMARRAGKHSPNQVIDLEKPNYIGKTILGSSVVAVWILDIHGRFLSVSPHAAEIAGYSIFELLGKSCALLVVPADQRKFSDIFATLAASGKHISDLETRILRKDGTQRMIRIEMECVELDSEAAVVVTMDDMTSTRTTESALRQSERELRLLSTRLLDMQDDERRKISRELHDGTAQNLFAISMNLSQLIIECTVPRWRKVLEECMTLCERSREEIRTLSYLLHPPLLDEAGLVPALKWYVEGFANRTGINVDFTVNERVTRLPVEIETDLFRVIQECLANVHRHSGSTRVAVQLDRDTRNVFLRVRDWGTGMPADSNGKVVFIAPGVGIPGMRERVKEHGGRFEITSSGTGTLISVVMPIHADMYQLRAM
jgi:PAS domain S-box-containing protein